MPEHDDPPSVARTQVKPRAEKPRLWKVILLNDDFTPRDFVVKVLRNVFRMSVGEAEAVMLTAHQLGACVVAVYTREIAETKVQQGNDMGAEAGHPLTCTTERED